MHLRQVSYFEKGGSWAADSNTLRNQKDECYIMPENGTLMHVGGYPLWYI